MDVVIANAAINLSPGTSLREIDVDEQMETLKVNVRISLLLSGTSPAGFLIQNVVPGLRGPGSGGSFLYVDDLIGQGTITALPSDL